MKICLNMICKNEGPRIRRCLESVLPIIDSYCIVDTGSTDDTLDVIADVLKDVPGYVSSALWTDFAAARTSAVVAAQSYLAVRHDAVGTGIPDDVYLLFLDADDYVDTGTLRMLGLPADAAGQDCYDLRIDYGPSRYYRPALVRASLPWHYRGVLHEFLALTDNRPFTRAQLDSPRIIIGGKPETSTVEKYEEHARILERALATESDPFMQSRYTYYLAQSYRDSKQDAKAAAFFGKRATLGGWDEEVYVAKLEMARALKRLGTQGIGHFTDAWDFRPSRLEAIGEAIVYCRETSQWHLGYALANCACDIKPPKDMLFVEPSWHEWKLQDEASIAAFWTGHYAASAALCEALLHLAPAEHHERIKANLAFAQEKLK